MIILIAYILPTRQALKVVIGRLVGGVKANIGHAEPAAGMTGVAKLVLALMRAEIAPNAQLRLLNQHVGSTLRHFACALPLQPAIGLEVTTRTA